MFYLDFGVFIGDIVYVSFSGNFVFCVGDFLIFDMEIIELLSGFVKVEWEFDNFIFILIIGYFFFDFV